MVSYPAFKDRLKSSSMSLALSFTLRITLALLAFSRLKFLVFLFCPRCFLLHVSRCLIYKVHPLLAWLAGACLADSFDILPLVFSFVKRFLGIFFPFFSGTTSCTLLTLAPLNSYISFHFPALSTYHNTMIR